MTDGSTHHAPPASHAWLRAAGIGLLAAVTTFFAAAALWRPGSSSATIAAVIEYEPHGSTAPLELDRVRAEIASDAALRDALRASGQSDDATAIEALRSQLSIHRALPAPPVPGERIALQIHAADEEQGIALVQSLAQRFVRRPAETASLTASANELMEARAALASAQAKEDAARRALDLAVKEHFEQLQRVEATNHDDQGPAIAPPMTRHERPENPAWRKLAKQIADLEHQRETLLIDLTTEHPKVIDLDATLPELRSRLADLPRFLELQPDAPVREEEAHLPADAAPTVDPAPLAALQRHQAKVSAAQETYNAARALRLETQAAVEVLEQAESAAPLAQPRFSLAQSAQAIAHHPAVSPGLRLLVLLSASMLVFAVVTWSLRPRQLRRWLATADDVARQLQLPIIAHVKLGSGARV